jgi:hypothetical protein
MIMRVTWWATLSGGPFGLLALDGGPLGDQALHQPAEGGGQDADQQHIEALLGRPR